MSQFRITAGWPEGTIPIPPVHAGIDVTFEDSSQEWRPGVVDMFWSAGALRSLESEVATRELLERTILEYEIRPLDVPPSIGGTSVQRGVNCSDPELQQWIANFVSQFGAPLSDYWANPRPEVRHTHELGKFVSDLLDLQRCATHLIAVRTGETTASAWASENEDENTRNFARSLNLHLRPFHPRLKVIDEQDRAVESPPFSIISALAAQIFNAWIEEEIAFKTCPICGVQFQRQRDRAQNGQHRTTGVTYCSVKCGRNKANRDYRARQRKQERE